MKYMFRKTENGKLQLKRRRRLDQDSGHYPFSTRSFHSTDYLNPLWENKES